MYKLRSLERYISVYLNRCHLSHKLKANITMFTSTTEELAFYVTQREKEYGLIRYTISVGFQELDKNNEVIFNCIENTNEPFGGLLHKDKSCLVFSRLSHYFYSFL